VAIPDERTKEDWANAVHAVRRKAIAAPAILGATIFFI